MKKKIHILTFSLIVTTLLFVGGCDKEEVLSHGGNGSKGNTFSVEVLMPTNAATKVSLSETETGNILLEWKEGDKLNFLFIADEGAILEVVNDVPVIISATNSRKGYFDIELPSTIEGQFSLGVFYGAEPVVEGGQVLLTLAAPTGGASLSDVEESFVMGSMKDTQVGEAPTLQFEMLSSIVGVMVANESDAPIEIETLSIEGTDGYNWLNNATGAAKYSLEDDAFIESDHGSSLTFLETSDTPVTIATGESHKFYAMIAPTDDPQPDKTLDLVINGTTLEGALPAIEMESGKHYRLKAIYSTDNQWYRTPFSVKKVEVLPEDTNCHLINPPENGEEGAYRFKMPITRANEFWSITNYDGTDFSNPANILGAEDRWVADIVWKDVDVPSVTGALDKILIDFAPNGNKGIGPNAMVEFDINHDALEQYGNAIIGIRRADENFEPEGDYLWSWHIWISDYATNGSSYDLSNGRGQVTMDRNLGAKIATKDQPSSQGLMYQWGRKDPFPPVNDDYWNNTAGNVLGFRPTTLTEAEFISKQIAGDLEHGNVPTAVSNPASFITSVADADGGRSDWQYEWVGTTTSSSTLWKENAKTIFDPCPKGFKVAKSYSFALLTQAEYTPLIVYSPSTSTKRGGLFDNSVWFPLNGQKSRTNGALSSARSGSYIWSSLTYTASESGAGFARTFSFNTSSTAENPFNILGINYGFQRGVGLALRCMEWSLDINLGFDLL